MIYPNFDKPVIFIDAINGAVLPQVEIGRGLPIGYAITATPRPNTQLLNESELLAIIGLSNTLFTIIFGRQLKLFTKHHPLRWSFGVIDPGSRFPRGR